MAVKFKHSSSSLGATSSSLGQLLLLLVHWQHLFQSPLNSSPLGCMSTVSFINNHQQPNHRLVFCIHHHQHHGGDAPTPRCARPNDASQTKVSVGCEWNPCRISWVADGGRQLTRRYERKSARGDWSNSSLGLVWSE